MFRIAEKEKLNQISLTGMRAIIILGLLMVAPRSLEEIKKFYTMVNVFDESGSDDTIRIDINTLKTVGCEITRASQKTNYKYVLGNHPFSLKVNLEEIKVLKKVYKKLVNNTDIKTLLEYDSLLKKIATYICDTEIKEAFLGISVLKNYDIFMMQSILSDCKDEKILNLLYQVPPKYYKEKHVIAQKLVYRSEKLYLYCYDLDNKQSAMLNLSRVKSILSRMINKGSIKTSKIKVKFLLNDFGFDSLDEDETIIETREDGYLIEGIYHNDFIAMQRVLSFGSKCTVIEPESFRNEVIKKLKEMRKVYEK